MCSKFSSAEGRVEKDIESVSWRRRFPVSCLSPLLQWFQLASLFVCVVLDLTLVQFCSFNAFWFFGFSAYLKVASRKTMEGQVEKSLRGDTK
jgi:hypothetical protein